MYWRIKKFIHAFTKKYRDLPEELIYIHVGKCGGRSLLTALNDSEVIKSRFKYLKRVHISRPPILKQSHYLIVIRNPIERAISAFNWRYKLVIEDEVQKDRFEGEYDILKRYGSLNNLAELLYKDGNLDAHVASQFRKIHHLKEDISFYLSELLQNINHSQIFCVLSTETLDSDIDNLLKVSQIERVHENSSKVRSTKKKLSNLAYGNLRKFLAEDYKVIENLLKINHSTKAPAEVLLK